MRNSKDLNDSNRDFLLGSQQKGFIEKVSNDDFKTKAVKKQLVYDVQI